MTTIDRKLDPLRFKLEAKFSKDHVIHPKGRSHWRGVPVGIAGTEKWEYVRRLGQGAHGTVELQRSDSEESPELRAVKKLQPKYLKKTCGLDFQRELHTLIAVRESPDLFVQFVGWYEDKPGGLVFLAMEYLEDGDLGQYLKGQGPLSAATARVITKQLLEGLVFLHGKNICHRDLKPQNVLMVSKSPARVKIADFGVSKPTASSLLSLRQGTVAYMAPELLGMLPGGTRCTIAVDVWALGCMLYEMFTLETPFVHRRSGSRVSSLFSTISGILPLSGTGSPSSDMHLLLEFCKGTVELPSSSLLRFNIGDSMLSFVKDLLVADPRYRISAADALKDGWVLDQMPGADPLGLPDHLKASGNALPQPGASEISEAVLKPLLKDELWSNSRLQMLRDAATYQDAKAIILGKDAKTVTAVKNHYHKIVASLRYRVGGDRSDLVEYMRGMVLKIAAENGHLGVARLLLDCRVMVDTTSNAFGGRQLLQLAAGNGHFEMVKFLLESGVLQSAAENEDLGMMEFLLGGGGDLLVALQAAVENGHFKVVKLLIESKIRADARAARNGHLEMVKSLLEGGGYLSVALQVAVENRHLDMVELLLRRGAEVSVPSRYDGRMVLETAVRMGDLEIVKLLLRNGAMNNNTPGGHRNSMALQAAVENRYPKVVELLLENGAEVNTEPSVHDGRTALQTAAGYGDLQVVTLLLNYGAEVNTPPGPYYGRTALQAAAVNGNIEVAELLLKNKAEVNAAPGERYGRTALQAAVINESLDMVKLLLGEGAEVNAAPGPYYGRTALQAAAESKNLEAVKLLLKNHAEVNTAPGEHYGRTALQAAAGHGDLQMVKLLMDNGAKVNAAPGIYHGRTALQAAAEAGNLEVVEFLLENEAEINAAPGEHHGRTALQAATKYRHSKVIKLLRERVPWANATPNVQDYISTKIGPPINIPLPPLYSDGQIELRQEMGKESPGVVDSLENKAEASTRATPNSVFGRPVVLLQAEAEDKHPQPRSSEDSLKIAELPMSISKVGLQEL